MFKLPRIAKIAMPRLLCTSFNSRHFLSSR